VLPRGRTTLDVAHRARLRAGLDPVEFDEKAAAYVAKDPAGYRAALEVARTSLAGVAEWTAPALDLHLRQLAEAKGMKLGALMQPVRIALTGATVSEPVNELIATVGKDLTLQRVAEALKRAAA